MEKKLAVCIPTYNRPDVVGETLIRSLSRYRALGWDLYVFDSSTNDETQTVVENMHIGEDHLFYHRIDSSVHSNRKVYDILRRFGEEDEYEYIWICSDSVNWNDECLKRVDDELPHQNDLILVNYRDVEKLGTCCLTDPDEVFHKCAWHMTLYGATIVRVGTVLKNVDWDGLISRYCIPDRINHSHVALYFEQLAKLDPVRVMHLSFPRKIVMPSPLKVESGWRKDTFFVWCHCWPSMICALPELYTDKQRVILQSGINSEILIKKNMAVLRKDGIYDFSQYCKYRKKWKELTTIPAAELLLLSLCPKKAAWIFDWKNHSRKKKYIRSVHRFIRRFESVYVYGCGIWAGYLSDILEEENIEYAGYVVSSQQNEKTSFRGKQVRQIDEKLLDDPKVGFILGVSEGNARDITDGIGKGRENRFLGGLN